MSRRAPRRAETGQALVEFSFVLIPFIFILLGIADLGRAIYVNNGTAQAAREIARVTSVHRCDTSPCTTIGTSPETAGVIATQKGLVPGLSAPAASIAITCTDVSDNAVTATDCTSGDFVKVTIRVPFSAVTPLIGGLAPSSLGSTTHLQIP